MEKIPNMEENKSKIEEAFTSLVSKFKRIGIVSAVAISSLLTSCEGGPKNEASAQTIENHIENPSIEKVPQEKISEVESAMNEYFAQKQAENNYFHGRVFEDVNGSKWIIHFDNPTDSTVEIKANLNSGPDKREGVFMTNVDVEFSKKSGAVLRYTESDEIIDGEGSVRGLKSENKSAYIVAEDGSVQTNNYKKGEAEKMVDKVIQSKKPSDTPRKEY